MLRIAHRTLHTKTIRFQSPRCAAANPQRCEQSSKKHHDKLRNHTLQAHTVLETATLTTKIHITTLPKNNFAHKTYLAYVSNKHLENHIGDMRFSQKFKTYGHAFQTSHQSVFAFVASNPVPKKHGSRPERWCQVATSDQQNRKTTVNNKTHIWNNVCKTSNWRSQVRFCV